MATGALGSDPTKRSILPTTCPYMVNLHRFFETDNAIYLLLQYASGGRLWSYIAGYLQQSSNQANATGDGVYPSGTGTGNVYMGQKMHLDSNAIPQERSPGSTQSSEKKKFSQKPVLSEAGVRFSELRAAVVSPDADIGGTLKAVDDAERELEILSMENESTGTQGDKNSTFADDLFDPCRLSSLSSDEFYHSVSQEEEEESKDKFPTKDSDDEAADHFQDLLQRNTVNLENFSINSFDSDTARLSSTFSTGDASSDLDPSSGLAFSPQSGQGPLSTIPDEVFSSDRPSSPLSSAQNEDGSLEVTDILENSRKLLQTVERTLSKVDDEEKSSSKDSDTPQVSEDASQRNCSKTSTDSNDSPEISIYDSHRHSDDESVDNSVTAEDKVLSDKSEADSVSLPLLGLVENGEQCDASGKLREVTGSQSNEEDMCAQGEGSEMSLSDTGTVTPLADSQTPPSLTGVTKASSDLTGTPVAPQLARHRSTSGTSQRCGSASLPRKISFNRSMSGEMARSASFEYDLKSPTRHRGRIVSDLFEQLDVECPEHVVLPEAVVQRWAAEIVIALSRLHALGIICRSVL